MCDEIFTRGHRNHRITRITTQAHADLQVCDLHEAITLCVPDAVHVLFGCRC